MIFGLNSFGQTVRIDTLIIPNGQRFTQNKLSDLRFPIVMTGDKKTDYLINNDLKNRFTHNEYSDLPVDSTLIKWTDDQISYLDFEVTYLKNGLISLNITAEGCGAYCTRWTDYFTYNLTKGKYLTINEIVDTTGKFRAIVLADKDKQYKQQKTDLKKMLLDKEFGLDEDTYNWALEQYENCDKGFTLNSFALYEDHLEIFAECYLPNAIKNLTPIIELKYKYFVIKKHLKIKN